MPNHAVKVALLMLMAALMAPLPGAARSTDAPDDDTPRPAPLGTPAGTQIWDGPATPVVAAAPPAPARVQPVPVLSPNPLWGIPLNALSMTRERPIFSASRRPPANAVARTAPPRLPPPPPPEPERPQLSLVGTISGSNEGFAILIDANSKAALRLKLGEDYQGWTLRTVEGREATLQKQGQAVVLSLPQPARVGEVRATGEADSARAPDAAQDARCRVKSHESCYD